MPKRTPPPPPWKAGSPAAAKAVAVAKAKAVSALAGMTPLVSLRTQGAGSVPQAGRGMGGAPEAVVVTPAQECHCCGKVTPAGSAPVTSAPWVCQCCQRTGCPDCTRSLLKAQTVYLRLGPLKTMDPSEVVARRLNANAVVCQPCLMIAIAQESHRIAHEQARHAPGYPLFDGETGHMCCRSCGVPAPTEAHQCNNLECRRVSCALCKPPRLQIPATSIYRGCANCVSGPVHNPLGPEWTWRWTAGWVFMNPFVVLPQEGPGAYLADVRMRPEDFERIRRRFG